MKQTTTQVGNKKAYRSPELKKVGSLKTITLKTGSTTDGGLPRTV